VVKHTNDMARRFELQRVFSMSSPSGVERIVSSLFVSQPPVRGGGIVLSFPSSVGGRRAVGSADDEGADDRAGRRPEVPG
jgi:hypothetical protein